MSTGSGIPASEQQELLGKLTQADEARRRLQSCAAPLVQQVADKHARRRWLRRRLLRAAQARLASSGRPAWVAVAVPAATALALACAAAWQIRRQPGTRR